MNIGILGTGIVGRTIAHKLESLGHDVMIGTRDVARTLAAKGEDASGHQAFGPWHARNADIKVGTFAQAAAHGSILFNATSGTSSVDALGMAGVHNLGTKVLVDVSNPLDYSKGMPPTLTVCNDDSVGEQIQRAFPRVRVVKTLNTVNATLMVEPGQLAGGDHTMFVCGDDADAKLEVTGILTGWFGWKDVLDLGGISSARGMEMYLPIWIRMWGALRTPAFNVKVVR